MDMDALREWIRERADEGEFATINTFLDEVIEKSKGDDEYRSSADARIEEYARREEDWERERQELKARNYDLLMQLPADEDNQGDGVVVEDAEDDAEIIHIDNLFADEDEKEND